jgi:hypothetical protein
VPRLCRSTLPVLGALTIALGCAAPAVAAPGHYFGFNETAVFQDQVPADTAARLAQDAGADSLVVTVDWRAAEPQRGVFRWRAFDEIYDASLARGIRPVFSVLYAPPWSWADGLTCEPDPRYCRYPPSPEHDDDWRDFVRRVADRYPELAAIQIWNEPNIPQFWQGGIDPERYTEMLKLAYAATKSENAELPVLGAALANWWGDDGERGMADRRFLRRMYYAGAKGHMDGIAVHPYPADIDLWQFFKTLTDLRTVRDAAGDSDTKLWATETGASTTDPANHNFVFNERDQAAVLVRVYGLLRSMPDVGGTFVHTLIEPEYWPETDKEHGFGMAHDGPDLVPKPAYCALAAANEAAFTCPAEVPVEPGTTDPAQGPRWDAQELVQRAVDAARRYRAQNGSYAGLTNAELHSLDPALSTQPADGGKLPAPSADPSRIGIWLWGTGPDEHLLLCNTSRADRSYCVWGKPDGTWSYGSVESAIFPTAAATLLGYIWWW